MRRFSVPLPAGNPHEYSYEDIYSEYWDVIRDYVFSTSRDYHFAEDVAQEVMLQVLKRLDWIQRDKLAPAIATITHTTLIDMHRADKGHSAVTYFEDELTFECHDEGISDPIHDMLRGEKVGYINELYRSLRKEDVKLFNQFYIDCMTVADICAAEKVSRGAVYIRLHRLRTLFVSFVKERLGDEDDD